MSPVPVVASRVPVIIQGGMGIGVSGWPLARAVSAAGQLGVVSGFALDALLARRLQHGDPDGTLRRALAAFPLPEVAERVLARYFVSGGIAPGRPYRPSSWLSLPPRRASVELVVVANFVEVYLAKRGHRNPVGVNYLAHTQLATAAAGYGALLAGVDYVLMGAGIPGAIPSLLTALAAGRPVEVPVTVTGARSPERYRVHFDPRSWFGTQVPVLARPRFLAIVSSALLASRLAGDPRSAPDGFVVQVPGAGGHSARPRPRAAAGSGRSADEPDLAGVSALGLPYWLAGGQAGAGRLAAARATGAAGVQVGTAFALCRESGVQEDLRRHLVERALAGTLTVDDAGTASPTRFPFKVVRLPETLSEEEVYATRPRLCDLGCLRVPFRRANGTVGYRCPAEPTVTYLRKGGALPDASGRRCLCNGLMSTAGLGQHRRDGYVEPPVVTLGQHLDFLTGLVARSGIDFTAADVVDYLLIE